MPDNALPERDNFFQLLVHTMNAEGPEAGIGVTLATPGGIITSDLISVSRYFELVAGGVFDVPEFQQRIKEEVAAMEGSGKEKVPVSALQHYHLADARFVTGAGLVPTVGEGMLWRGRIQEVSGFSMKSLSQR
jgi:hypothetical protein